MEFSSRSSFLAFAIGHDANACVLTSDKIWTYENAERVDRLKQSSDYLAAVENIFSRSGIAHESVQNIAITTTQGGVIPILNPKKFTVLKWKTAKSHFSLVSNFEADDFRKKSVISKWIPFHKDVKTTSCPAIHIQDKARLTQLMSGKLKVVPRHLIARGKCAFYGRTLDCFHVEHHFAHICSSFARQKNANICISMDGSSGSIASLINFPFWGGLSAAIDDQGNILFAPPPLFAGGILYTKIAHKLGLTEGKLMGLSGYFVEKTFSKEFRYAWESILRNIEHLFSFNQKKLSDMASHGDASFVDLAAEETRIDSYLDEFVKEIVEISPEIVKPVPQDLFEAHGDMLSIQNIAIAGAVQKIFNRLRLKAVGQQINYFADKGIPFEGIVFTGGCTLNCPSNAQLFDLIPNVSLFFDNACNDEGLSIGVSQAMHISGLLNEFDLSQVIEDGPYLGSYPLAQDEAVSRAKQYGLRVLEAQQQVEFINCISDCVSAGDIAILCHGKYESGPRALGNRSLIADASRRETHDLLNKIKIRENWRPIAPMVRKVDFHEYFSGPMDPNMLMTNSVKMPSRIPGVTHYDNSARVQVVSNEQLFIYKVMTELFGRDKCPVLANTSLNQNNEPLINSCMRALDLMMSYEEIRCLYLGEYLISKD